MTHTDNAIQLTRSATDRELNDKPGVGDNQLPYDAENLLAELVSNLKGNVSYPPTGEGPGSRIRS